MHRLRISSLLLALAGCGDSAASTDSHSAGNDGTRADTTMGDCAIGFEGCPCSQAGSCLDDLACVGGVCVGGGQSAAEVPTGSASESASAGTSNPASTTTTTQTTATDSSFTASASASDSSSSSQVSDSEAGSTEHTMGASISTGGTTGTTGTTGTDGDPDSQGETASDTSSVCGDGVAEGEEVCDGADLGGKTCSALGFQYGKLGCTPACAADTSKCTNSAACSDGILAPNVLCYAPPQLLTEEDVQSRQVGDFNEDGHLDVVGVLSDDPYVVTVRFGNGDGTFIAQGLKSANVKLSPKRVVDLDKDGHLDVVGTVTAKIRVALGDGTGKLTATFDYDTYASAARIELIDVTADGWLDLVNCGASKVARFRRGQPGGLFGPAVSYDADATYETGTCGFADIDADGFLDMWAGAGPRFYWWHGDGDAHFTADPVVTNISVGSFAAVTPLDDDEYPDIAGWSNSGPDLRVRLGSPMGFSGMLYTYPIESGATANYYSDAQMVGNFDGNDIPDIVAHGRSVADVFRGDGTGLFYDGVALGYMVHDVQGIAVGDFNEDGIDDFVIGYLVNFGDTTDYIVLSDP